MGSGPYDFSIIIPTFNRLQELAVCLLETAKLNYAHDRFEVIVVDDGGRMSLDRLIDSFTGRMQIRLITQANAGPAAARNAGVRFARGKFVAFLDDDCAPAPDWLSILMERLKENPNRMIGGKTINVLNKNIYAEISQRLLDSVYSFYNAKPEEAKFFACNNMAMPAAVFRQIGGFRPGFRVAEDRELCDIWKYFGFPMVYEPQARMYHFHRLALHSFWKQHKAYGRGAFRFNRTHAQRYLSSTLDLNFYLWVFKKMHRLMLKMPREEKRAMILLLSLWKIANATGFLIEGAKWIFRKTPADLNES
jgi:glycosyltransferase involved in cell wall biosynthesis